MNKRNLLLIIGLMYAQQLFAWNWSDLWLTKNYQAKILMNQGEFAKAKTLFEREDWRATAAFRAGHYAEAAELFQKQHNYYNQGNALAYMQHYAEAIKAYNRALAINSHHSDALHNRKIVEELLKKQQDKQNKQNEQNSPEKKSRDQEKQQAKQESTNQEKNNSLKEKEQQDKAQEKEEKKSSQSEQKEKPQLKPEQQKAQEKSKEEKNTQSPKEEKQTQQEQKQAKDQWLRLIPDDPGGLLREKFLRDYLRRQQE